MWDFIDQLIILNLLSDLKFLDQYFEVKEKNSWIFLRKKIGTTGFCVLTLVKRDQIK